MGTTPKLLLPYPEPTDAVADGATAIKNLALALDGNRMLWAHAQSVGFTATAAVGSTFPEKAIPGATGTVNVRAGFWYEFGAYLQLKPLGADMAEVGVGQGGVWSSGGFYGAPANSLGAPVAVTLLHFRRYDLDASVPFTFTLAGVTGAGGIALSPPGQYWIKEIGPGPLPV